MAFDSRCRGHCTVDGEAKRPGGLDADAFCSEPGDAGLLRLDSTKARSELGWQPRWSLTQAVAETTRWYRAWHQGGDMRAFTARQIAAYSEGEP